MLIGLVKWFNQEKGFGIVENPSEGEFFLHINNFPNKPHKITKGTAIIFKQKIDDNKKRNTAENCRLIGEIDDWKLIMKFLDKPDKINIEVEVKGSSSWGNPYTRKVIESCSLKDLAANQLFREKSESELLSMVTDYFDAGLNKKLFVTYCEFIERRINKSLVREIALNVLADIYSHFGQNINEEVLFYTWKSKAFKFIAYKDDRDYAIPESVLNAYSNEIGYSELERLVNYEFGSTFCNDLINSKFKNIGNLTTDQLKELYSVLEFASKKDQEQHRAVLDIQYTDKILAEIVEQALKLQPIKNNYEYNKYIQLNQLVTNQVSEKYKIKITEAINEIIAEKCSEEFKPEIWLKGIIDMAPFELISKTFYDDETRIEKRLNILLKVSLNQRIELLKYYFESSGWDKTFEIVEKVIQNEKMSGNSLEIAEISKLLLKNFSFKFNDCVTKLKTLLTSISVNEESKKKLRSTLDIEKEEIISGFLISVFIELKDYEIIKEENSLLELLLKKKLEYSEIRELVSIITNNCKISLFSELISINIEKISSYKRFELLESCGQKFELCIALIDEYYSLETDYTSQDFHGIINFLLKSKSEILCTHFLDKFYKKLSLKYPVSILELAIFVNHRNAQKFAYQNLIFRTENEIVNFIHKYLTLVISDEVKSENKPLTAFLNFLSATTDFDLTNDCKAFLQHNKGIVQCLSVKYLVFQYHKKFINKIKLLEILNSFLWSEISALLVKAFVEESNHTEKILLDKLNGIFKAHFEILSTEKLQPKTFLDNFTMRNILKYCDGRKIYNGELWQGNGISRWYVSGGGSFQVRENLNCYCEGRPWKKETFWDSQTNTPINQQFEKYWCKTNYCAFRNDSVDVNLPFHQWTLSEIGSVLNITVEKIALATLAGWVNRMNQIIEHLFCRNCKEVLRPLPFRPELLGYYAVPLFHCINDSCTENQTIRFTHCLNGKCESHKKSEPLDSRDCKSCRPNDPNHTGLECNYCGSSCPTCSGHFNKIIAQEVW